MATKVIIRTHHGVDLAEPIEDQELEIQIREGTAKLMEGIIYKEVPKPKPRKKRVAKKKVEAKSSTYQTKVQTPEKSEKTEASPDGE